MKKLTTSKSKGNTGISSSEELDVVDDGGLVSFETCKKNTLPLSKAL